MRLPSHETRFDIANLPHPPVTVTTPPQRWLPFVTHRRPGWGMPLGHDRPGAGGASNFHFLTVEEAVDHAVGIQRALT
jgi:hypothetical protein